MAGGTDEARKIAVEKMEAARAVQKSDDSKTAETEEEQSAITGKTIHSAPKKQTVESAGNELHNVKIYSPFRVYYDGSATSLSAINGTGPFDVLPGHKNFLSLLKKCSLIVRNKRGEEALDIERGVLHVRDDQITVFLDV